LDIHMSVDTGGRFCFCVEWLVARIWFLLPLVLFCFLCHAATLELLYIISSCSKLSHEIVHIVTKIIHTPSATSKQILVQIVLERRSASCAFGLLVFGSFFFF